MDAVINRKSAMFRLREELLERLKQLAARDNRSLNIIRCMVIMQSF